MSLRESLIRWLGGTPPTSSQTVAPLEVPQDHRLGDPRLNPMKIKEGYEQGIADPDMTPAQRDPKEFWKLREPPPNVLPKGMKLETMAMDSGMAGNFQWAMNSVFAEGLDFMGYPYLAELTQRAEYRRPAEIIARAMTRKGIKFKTKSGDESKSEQISQLQDAFISFKVMEKLKLLAEQDGYFGRSQLYLDTGYTDMPDELKTELQLDPAKIPKGGLKNLTVIEPMWTYPNFYNSIDPLKPDFFKPQTWFVMGKEIHHSRLLTFVSRPVPDILKPVYSFGGLSLSQMAKPYVDNWLRNRQSVSDLVRNFSTTALKTNMSAVLNGGGAEELYKRARMFNLVRNNRGLMLLDNEMEDLVQVNAPLGSLDKLQAQAQEHMATVWGIPLIIAFAITPSGLNASSKEELEVFQGWTLSNQEAFYRKHLTTIMYAIMLHLWGNMDQDITFEFEPLTEQDMKEIAEVHKINAERDAAYIEAGVLSNEEARENLAQSKDSPYTSIDLSTPAPEPPEDEDTNAAMQALLGGGGGGHPPQPGGHEHDDDDAGDGSYPRLGQTKSPVAKPKQLAKV